MEIKDTLKYFKFCFQKRNDQRFIKNIYRIENDDSLVNIQKMDGEKEGIRCYYIAPDASGSGFFADHNRLLSYLYYADYFGLCPVVEYGSGYSYAEEKPVDGVSNPFEYYFKQPAEVSLEDLKEEGCVVKSRKENAALAGRLNTSGKGYDWSEEYLKEMGRISSKYIHLNEKTDQWMKEQLNKVLGEKKMIGVHVRGTDFKRNYKGHPVKISTQEYLEATKKLYDTGKYEGVFLATDDAEATDVYGGVFGDKLKYYQDVVRSSGDETVMKSEVSRMNHHYLLGREVLRDAWTLGKCSALVAGMSQVSFGARILKEASGNRYEDLVLLDKGMNRG